MDEKQFDVVYDYIKQKFDKNGDGKFNLQEFVEFIMQMN